MEKVEWNSIYKKKQMDLNNRKLKAHPPSPDIRPPQQTGVDPPSPDIRPPQQTAVDPPSPDLRPPQQTDVKRVNWNAMTPEIIYFHIDSFKFVQITYKNCEKSMVKQAAWFVPVCMTHATTLWRSSTHDAHYDNSVTLQTQKPRQ